MIDETLITKTALDLYGKEISEQLKFYWNSLSKEIKFFIDDGVKKYLDKKRKSFVKVKNILHLNEVEFLKVYHRTRLIEGDSEIGYQNINDLFEEGNFVTIIGDAGSGKSTFVKYLFLNCIQTKIFIPIIIELRDLNNDENSLEEYLKSIIFENKLSGSESILERVLKKGKFIFFLDGYDEVKSESRKKVLSSLNKFIENYGENKFIITSRPYSNIEYIQNFRNYRIAELSNDDIENFILKQRLPKALGDDIVRSIKDNSVQYIKSFLSNPLLLSLYILTFKRNPDIPSKKYIFYRRVFDVLFKEHDTITKFAFERQLKCSLSQEDYEKILQMFSFISFFKDTYAFDKSFLTESLNLVKDRLINLKFDNNNLIEDLKTNICLWVEDGGEISFAHRSMQEYFAALYIKNLKPENKKIIYDKINERLLEVTHFDSNFLSLCREMDVIHYYKYLAVPILKEISYVLDKPNTLEKLKTFSMLSFHIGRMIGVNSKVSHMFMLPKEKTLTTFETEGINTYNITKNLYDIAQGIPFSKLKKKFDPDKNKEDYGYHEVISKLYISEFGESSTSKKLDKVRSSIVKKIEEIEIFIKVYEDNEDALVKMIS